MIAFSHTKNHTMTATAPVEVSITKKTYTYAVKDHDNLQLDVYQRPNMLAKSPCVLFVFGGGFKRGSRDCPDYYPYFTSLVRHGYAVISISYRLGLKGAGKIWAFRVKPLKRAIDIAVEDLFDATNWLFDHANELRIDPGRIVLSGSSAGAMTVLQGDYEKRNNTELSKRLPANFQYAGVVSFAGAILRFDGGLNYRTPPAPTMLFHGTDDKLVFYNKIRIFNKGFYGSSPIAAEFKKRGFPYYICRVADMGHEVAITPLQRNLPEILGFLDAFVRDRKAYQVDVTLKDPEQKRTSFLTPDQVYK
ncbi:alpha/beta hydrolase [Spirosoma validum]|uniref:Alpha/beta hydrolase n=1 Tax=Spirosoma validum TaxID=2771355 RepID=A0A927B6M3_9BACT|nr:alpha/beta hydrolase [Spirosoma validum]MBD2756132.1 alpha/beta hydrolase [Spirosoma validum]